MSDISDSYSHFYNVKRIRYWRFIAFFIFILALISGFAFFASSVDSKKEPYIAEIEIEGMIIDAGYQVKKIRELYADDAIKGIILAVNSPGGTTYDSEILFDALRYVSQKKPIVVYMKNVAASGGYIVALAGEKIYAAKNTITGSIGVLMQAPNFKNLLDNLGISVTEIKSSPIKGEPNYFSETPQQAIDNLKAVVDETNVWFMKLVQERRPAIGEDNIASVATGAIFTGQQAVRNKLIDGIGGQSESKDYLVKKYKLNKKIDIVEVAITEQIDESMIDMFLNHAQASFSRFFQNILPIKRNNVDGLLSLWQS